MERRSQRHGATLLAALLLLACATGCASSRGSGATPDVVSGVRAARERWNAALLARDSGALAALVEDSAVHVSPGFTHVGRTAYLTVFLRGMATRAEFRLRYEPERVTACAPAGCGVATEYGRWRETWRQDAEPTEVSGSYFAIWRRHGARWQIRSESFATDVCRGRRYCVR
jgi:ketosteroid isomerase-like protein